MVSGRARGRGLRAPGRGIRGGRGRGGGRGLTYGRRDQSYGVRAPVDQGDTDGTSNTNATSGDESMVSDLGNPYERSY